MDPGVIVGVVGCELNGGVVVNVVVGMPVAYKESSAEIGILFWSCLSLARRLCSLCGMPMAVEPT